jgi:hypothetical protein
MALSSAAWQEILVRYGPNKQLPFAHQGGIRVVQRNEFGGASPGLLTQVRKHANLGHPYGVATTSAAASVHYFVDLRRQVVCSR